MRYVKAKQREAFERKAYRIYVSDSLRALVGNENNPHYMDMIDTNPPDEQSAEDIIEKIKNKAKGGQ